jgi:glycosyltransferase involved in cell wall biosynthesis
MYIIYSHFFSEANEEVAVGGIQTYILGLMNIFHKDYDVKVVQKSSRPFIRKMDHYMICSYQVKSKNIAKGLYKCIRTSVKEEDFIIWASDRISCKTNHKRTIAIQHGITFDFLDYKNIRYGKLLKKYTVLAVLYKKLQHLSAIRYFLHAKTVVCVDYNYLNWIRTIMPRKITNRAIVIPNFSEIPQDINQKDTKTLNILFARRFVDYRGVYILIDVIKEILKKYKNVHFGVYGEGPLGAYIKNEVKDYEAVKVSKFSPSQTHEIFSKFHISLIPTIGSEGTSLSLIESMAHQCVPIVSDVGGMTNIVLDDFNGYLVSPNADEFIKRISFLVENPVELERISKNAKATVEKSFSFKSWSTKWISVLEGAKNN